MKLSLFFHALGLAYFAFCPDEERASLLSMASDEERHLLAEREADWLKWRVETARERGFAERDPATARRALPARMALGAVLNGHLSDRLFGGNRNRPIALFLALSTWPGMVIRLLGVARAADPPV